MKTLLVERDLPYDGTAIRSLWAYREFGLQGDSLVAFAGPCDIPFDHMVDLEDVKARSAIASPRMLHFIAEHFDLDLEKTVLRQRVLAVLVGEALARRLGRTVDRRGDDLFDSDRKLSISIATATPVSTKIHFGINIRSEGTPVPTKGLADYGIDPAAFAREILEAYPREMEEVRMARCKVRGVE